MSARMFPLFTDLLPAEFGHHPTYRAACEFPEAPPVEVYFAGSCPACVIAQHAHATIDPGQQIKLAGVPGLVRLDDATNRFIVQYGLPLPLIESHSS